MHFEQWQLASLNASKAPSRLGEADAGSVMWDPRSRDFDFDFYA